MQGKAVHDGAHAEFTHAVGDIVALVGLHVHVLGGAGQRAHGAREVGGAAHQFGQAGHEAFKGFLGGHARCRGFGLAHGFFNHAARNGGPVFGQFAAHTAGKFCGKLGIGLGVGGIGMLPGGLGSLALFTRVPSGIQFLRHGKGLFVPAQSRAGGCNAVVAKGRTVAGCGIGLGRTKTNVRTADDQAGAAVVGLGLGNGGVQRGGVMAVDGADDLPVVGAEAARHVFVEPAVDLAVNGNTVGVIKGNELAQAPGASQGAGFVRNAFHEAAVAGEHIGVVIHNLMLGRVVAGGQHAFGQRHAHGGRNTLPQRAGGHFNAQIRLVFGMPCGFGSPLAEVA